MKTILVPVDFSDTAKNSALFAAHFAAAIGAKKMVLYNAYSMPLATEMSWAVLQTEELQKASQEGLDSYKVWLTPICGEGIVIEVVSDFGFLADRINEVAAETGADCIVMGITGGGKLAEVLIGSNTLHVVHHTHIPVLIVPADALWKKIKVAGWLCDYREVNKTTPVLAIQHTIKDLSAKLVIMHNDPAPLAFDPEVVGGNVLVTEMMHDQQPVFELLNYDNFLTATDAFVTKHQIDMLIIVPQKHSWFAALFETSHTKRLAFHSHVPLLCVQSLKA